MAKATPTKATTPTTPSIESMMLAQLMAQQAQQAQQPAKAKKDKKMQITFNKAPLVVAVLIVAMTVGILTGVLHP